MCLAAFQAQAEAEAEQDKIQTKTMGKKGTYNPSSFDAMRKIDDSVYAEVNIRHLCLLNIMFYLFFFF